MNDRTNSITVTVSSHAGVGKTTIAELLQEFFTRNGFTSHHVEFEKLNEAARSEGKQRRLKSVRDSATITIVEQSKLRTRI